MYVLVRMLIIRGYWNNFLIKLFKCYICRNVIVNKFIFYEKKILCYV